MKKSYRKNKILRASSYIFLVVVVVLIGILSGCSKKDSASPAPTDSTGKSGLSGEIVVASFGGKYDDTFTNNVIKPFQAANPGVTVKLAPFMSVAKLSQGGSSSVDAVILDDFDIVDAADKGLLAPFDKKDFKQWDNLYQQAFMNGKEGKTYGIANIFGAYGIAYNPDKVDKPQSWNDFFNPKIAGKVALQSQWIPDIMMIAKANNATPENMAPAWDAFKKLTPSVAQYYTSSSAPQALFESGEIVMSSWFDGRANSLKKAGKKIEFTIPKEGGVLVRSGMGIVAKSKKQDITRALIDFSLTEVAQKGFANDLLYGPTNSTVKLDQTLQDLVVYGKDEINALDTPDWNKLLPLREGWLTKWTEVTTR